MKFISWNVNGLRACLGKGFQEYFDRADADFFCLQETKLSDGQLSLPLPGYHAYWNYADKKGYSGTAVFAREEPLNVTYGVGVPELDTEGRMITLEYPKFYLVTQKNDGRAHFAHQLVRNVAARHRRSVHLQRCAVAPHAAAEVAQNGDGRVHVAQTRTVLDAADVPREDRRRQHGQDAVLAALYRQFSVKRRAALDAQIAHVPFLPFPMGQQTKP